jgi:hypothetical protein
MKMAKILAAMLLLPTLAVAQTATADPSLKVATSKQTIGFSSGGPYSGSPTFAPGVMGNPTTTFMLVSPPVQASNNFMSEQLVAQTSAVAGTFKNLYVTELSPGSVDTNGTKATGTYTWRINGVSTGITCTIVEPATTCSDLVHTAPIVAGQTYDLQTVGVGNIISPVYGGIELDTP